MSNTKFTPGIWSTAYGSHRVMSTKRTGSIAQSFVMDLPGPHNNFLPDSEGLANAKLIAAAPDLLDICQMINASEPLPKHLSDQLEFAIKKATD